MSARPRHNIARLPHELRQLIAEMLDDGRTYDEVRSDPEVAAACAKAEILLHSTTFIAFRASPEYAEYCRMRREYGAEIERRRMAAFFVDQEGGADAIAKVANFELLKIVLAKLELGGDLEPKELAAVSGALAAYNRNRISEAKDDAKRDYAARETEYQARIAELSAKVAELSSGVRNAGLNEATLKNIEEKIGLL